jgi:hypothetical protein
MAPRSLASFVVGLACGLLADTSLTAQERDTSNTSGSPVEEIYVGRSWRESRQPPTDFCTASRTGFGKATIEDTYSFRSVDVRGSDGRVVDSDVAVIGRLRACFGADLAGRTGEPVPESASFFYAEGVLGDVPFIGRGDCRTTRRDYPEPGISSMRCFMELSGLPAAYVGGQLTTNTISSRSALGDGTDPPGYTQPSIATIRLWRRR